MIRTDRVVTQIHVLFGRVTQYPTQFIQVDEKSVGYSVAEHLPYYKMALVTGEVVRSPYHGEQEELFDAKAITDTEFRENVDSVIEARESGLSAIVYDDLHVGDDFYLYDDLRL